MVVIFGRCQALFLMKYRSGNHRSLLSKGLALGVSLFCFQSESCQQWFQVTDVDLGCAKVRISENAAKQTDIGGDATDVILTQGPQHALNR